MVIGASLRALLLEYEHKQRDRLLPQVMRTVRSSPHETTGETANYMMLGREVRLPDALHLEVIQSDDMDASEYARELQQRLHIAASHLREMQRKIMDETSEEPHVYSVGDEVWLKSLYKKKGENGKLLPKYIGPYTITGCLPYHVYQMERGGKTTIQHEGRIRLLNKNSSSAPSIETGAKQSETSRDLAPGKPSDDQRITEDQGEHDADSRLVRRSKRITRQPDRYRDFHLD